MYELYKQDFEYFEALAISYKKDKDYCLLNLTAKQRQDFEDYENHKSTLNADILRYYYGDKSYYHKLKEVETQLKLNLIR